MLSRWKSAAFRPEALCDTMKMLKWHNHLVLWNSQSIVTGIVAILMSRNLRDTKLVRISFFGIISSVIEPCLCSKTRFILIMFSYLQQIGLLVLSILNAVISAACCIGLLLAISLTVTNNGEGLMLGCNDTEVPINARSPVSARCPFDTTRIYVSLKAPLPLFHHLLYLFLLFY